MFFPLSTHEYYTYSRAAAVGQDVRSWLAIVGLEKLSGRLVSVDGPCLLGLTCGGLLALGLNQPEANQLLQHIQWLRQGNGRLTEESASLPEEFLCPITRDIMRCPVRCQDGFVYEEVAIKGRDCFSLVYLRR